MKELVLFIPGEPMSKQRPRFSTRGAVGRAYTPKQTVTYENLIKTIYMNKLNPAYWDNEPMSITILALFKIPSSYSKAKARQCELGYHAPSSKDVDNILKICQDGLNGVAYSDDKHICHASAIKAYTADSSKMGVYIYITDYLRNSTMVDIMIKKVREDQENAISLE